MSQVNNKDTRRVSIDIFLASLLLTLNIFHILLYCLCCYFERVNTHWVNNTQNKCLMQLQIRENIITVPVPKFEGYCFAPSVTNLK